MKLLKTLAKILISVPLVLIGLLIAYEALGFCVNHIATGRQTKQLVATLEAEVPDIEIIDIHSETGNTGPTGNHVDCLSVVTFSTGMEQSDLEDRLYRHYEYDMWTCYLSPTEDGNYLFRLNTSAPFVDNIEGH